MVKLSRKQIFNLERAHSELQSYFKGNKSTMSLSDIHSACQTGKELVVNGKARTNNRNVADFFSLYLNVMEENGSYILEV